MQVHQSEALRSFDLINSAAQQRLQERITDANGDIDRIRREIQAELEHLDQEEANQREGAASNHQGDRAFYVGQIAYLDLIEQAAAEQEQPRQQGMWARFGSTFRRAEAAR